MGMVEKEPYIAPCLGTACTKSVMIVWVLNYSEDVRPSSMVATGSNGGEPFLFFRDGEWIWFPHRMMESLSDLSFCAILVIVRTLMLLPLSGDALWQRRDCKNIRARNAGGEVLRYIRQSPNRSVYFIRSLSTSDTGPLLNETSYGLW